MELMNAARQWAERPDDERYTSLEDLHAACATVRQQAASATVRANTLHAIAEDGEVLLNGSTGARARMSHWAFGQVARLVGAPAEYLAGLPAELAATNLQHGLSNVRDGGPLKLLLHRNGATVARAITSDRYTRIWNADVTTRLMRLGEDGWRVPPARPARDGQAGIRLATAADVLSAGAFGLSIVEGARIAPAGLYAGDRDMFAFLVDPTRAVEEPGGVNLYRGFFVWNSEVGAASFGVMTFLWRHVCGNHIVWGAKNVSELRIRHVGNADDRAFRELRAEVRKYADSSIDGDRARLEAARSYSLGSNKDEVLDRVFGLKVPGLTRPMVRQGYELAERYTDTDGSPRSAWGLSNGLTRLSQTFAHADARVTLDRAAGKLLEVAF